MQNAPIEMVHVRTFLFHSLSGHSVQFRGAQTPVRVPPAAVRECMAIGAAPTSEVDMPDNTGMVKNRLERAADDPVGLVREAQIKQAMKDLVGVNDPMAFDANGAPKMRSLNATLDFKVSADERNVLWTEVKMELGQTET